MLSGPDRCRPEGSADKWPSARPQQAERAVRQETRLRPGSRRSRARAYSEIPCTAISAAWWANPRPGQPHDGNGATPRR